MASYYYYYHYLLNFSNWLPDLGCSACAKGFTWPFLPTEFSLFKVTLRRSDHETLNINQKLEKVSILS